jgi:hypothetical protein
MLLRRQKQEENPNRFLKAANGGKSRKKMARGQTGTQTESENQRDTAD